MSKKIALMTFIVALMVTVLLGTMPVYAIDYPERSVTFIVPYSAGGGTDIIARRLSSELEDRLGVNFNVENYPGAGGATGFNRIASSKPNGYTIGLAVQPISALEAFMDIPFSPELLQPIAQVNSDNAAIVVKNDAEWKDAKEMINYAKNNPGELDLGLTAPGATWWQAGQILMYEADIDMNDVVYPGGAAPILRALMADEVDVGVVSAAEALSQVEDGELRYLALMSESKSELFPSVPLLEDSGFDISHSTWRGLAAPRGTPEEIINLLDETIAEIVKDEEFIEFMHNNRFGIKYRNSEQFGEFMRSERDNLIELSEVLENE